MSRIKVHPGYLRELGSQWQRAAGELQSIAGRLDGALGGLDWETRQKVGVEGLVNDARRRANALAGQAEAFARYLAAKAQAFEEADRAGASAVGQVVGVFVAAQSQMADWWQRFQPVFSLPRVLIEHLLRLGGMLIQAPVAWITAVASGMAGLLVGIHPLRRIELEWQDRLKPPVPPPEVEPGRLSRLIREKFETLKPPPIVSRPSVLDQKVRLRDGREILVSQLDGRTPVDGLDSIYGKPGQFPLNAPITSAPGARHPNLYAAVINQFGVEGNPRYVRDTYTYCNTFAGDVARAMGVPLPTKEELLGRKDDPATVGAADLNNWFITRSGEQGWREVNPSTLEGLRILQEHVNAGKPAFAMDEGHIAVIRPGQDATSVGDLRIAQAGAHNQNDVRLGDAGLGSTFKPRFFIHD